jgi:hypothetical protein
MRSVVIFGWGMSIVFKLRLGNRNGKGNRISVGIWNGVRWEYFRCIYLRSERNNAMICREIFVCCCEVVSVK